jgi:hypothetical protein
MADAEDAHSVFMKRKQDPVVTQAQSRRASHFAM